MESTTSTEDSVRNGDLVSRPATEATCSVTYEAPTEIDPLLPLMRLSVTRSQGLQRGGIESWGLVRAETDTSVDSRGTLVEYFLSVSDADATYDSEDSKEYFLEH